MEDEINSERLLVCEGRCNGDAVQRFDRACAARERIFGTDRSAMELAEDGKFRPLRATTMLERSDIALVRKFVHSWHRRINRKQSSCMDCGTVRRYDWPRPWDEAEKADIAPDSEPSPVVRTATPWAVE